MGSGSAGAGEEAVDEGVDVGVVDDAVGVEVGGLLRRRWRGFGQGVGAVLVEEGVDEGIDVGVVEEAVGEVVDCFTLIGRGG